MTQKQPVGMAVAKYDYSSSDCHELNITKGEKLTLLDDSQHWWQVMNATGNTGYVPSNFCKKSKQSIFSSLRNTLGRKKTKEPAQPVSCGASSVGTAPSAAGGRRSTGGSPKPINNTGMHGSATQNTNGNSHDLNTSNVSTQQNNTGVVCNTAGSLKSNGSSNNSKGYNLNQKSGHSMSYNIGQQSNNQSMVAGNVSQFPLQKAPSSDSHFSSTGNVSAPNNFSSHMQSIQSTNITSQHQMPPHSQPHFSSSSPFNGGVSSSLDAGGGNMGVASNVVMGGPSPYNTANQQQICEAKFSYTPCQPDELALSRGDNIRVIEKSSDGWWRGELIGSGDPGSTGTGAYVLASGWFPSNYVTLVKPQLGAPYQHSSSGAASLVRTTTDSLGRPLQQHHGITQQHHSSMPSVAHNLIGCHDVPGEKVLAGSGINNNNNNQWHHYQQQQYQPKLERYSTVLTLFPFTKNQPEEMSFQANEILEVLDRPVDDPDWWKCRNARGETGLVPTNYVKQVGWRSFSGPSPGVQKSQSPPPPQLSENAVMTNDQQQLRMSYNRSGRFSDRIWYWGAISRIECESLLMRHGFQGQFIVRDSESHPGDLTVTMHAKTKCRNFKVRLEKGEYNIGQKVFSSIESLIQHYRTHPIYKSDTERLFLTDPFQFSGTGMITVAAHPHSQQQQQPLPPPLQQQHQHQHHHQFQPPPPQFYQSPAKPGTTSASPLLHKQPPSNF